MPSKKSKRPVIEPTESDPDVSPAESIDAEDEDQSQRRDSQIGNLINFCLMSHAKKGAIKLEDLRKFKVLDDCSGKNISTLMESATKDLKDVFGMDMFEKTVEGPDGKISKPGIFFLRNLLKQEVEMVEGEKKGETELLKIEKDELAKKGLLLTVLMFLFMSEPQNCVTPEKHLIHFLGRLGFQEKVEHETFGKLVRTGTPQGGFLQDFVRSGWLETSKIQKSDPVEYEFRWGYRANRCVNKMQLLSLVSQIYDTKNTDWSLHHSVASKANTADQEDEPMEETSDG